MKSNLTSEKEIEGDWVEAEIIGKNNNKEEQILDFDKKDNNNKKKVITNNNEDEDFFGDDDNNNEINDFEIIDEEEKGEILKTRRYV